MPIGVISSILVILVPIPPGLLDLMLSLNISISVVVLLSTLYVRTPLEFSVNALQLASSVCGPCGVARRL